jgi:hypothetical protein
LEYCGHLVNLRTTTVDFKSSRTEIKPQLVKNDIISDTKPY